MPQDALRPDLTAFQGVDQADDPAALIAFLEASDRVPSIAAGKSTLLGELRLENARAALDVGCGFGTDVAELLARMPSGATASGIDISEIMIAEARRRTAGPGLPITFDVGDAANLPYRAGSFDACRAETLLQHLCDPQQALCEMARVTRPGGRVAVLEFDLGTTVVDHPDRETTQVILQQLADDVAQAWIGRRLPLLFHRAGLTDLSVTPAMVLASQQLIRMLLHRPASRLCAPIRRRTRWIAPCRVTTGVACRAQGTAGRGQGGDEGEGHGGCCPRRPADGGDHQPLHLHRPGAHRDLPVPPPAVAPPMATLSPSRLTLQDCRLPLAGREAMSGRRRLSICGVMGVIDEAEIRRMSPAERARLARVLGTFDDPPSPPPDPGAPLRRRLLIAAALIGALALAAWIGVLADTLPRYYRAGGWRITWIGFDTALLAVVGFTAWAAWRRRQVLILCLVVLATLLICDAWFDTTLDWQTRGFTFSLALALGVELPVAAMALIGARRLLRLTIGRMEKLEGARAPVPAFWRVPLFGDVSAGYRDVLRRPECLPPDGEGEPQRGEAGARTP